MIRELLARLSGAAEHVEEKSPNLAALLRDAHAVIERDRFIDVMRAERDLLQREVDVLEHYTLMCTDELESLNNLIAELEQFYADRDSGS